MGFRSASCNALHPALRLRSHTTTVVRGNVKYLSYKLYFLFGHSSNLDEYFFNNACAVSVPTDVFLLAHAFLEYHSCLFCGKVLCVPWFYALQ